jgi:hypothetical protein
LGFEINPTTPALNRILWCAVDEPAESITVGVVGEACASAHS